MTINSSACYRADAAAEPPRFAPNTHGEQPNLAYLGLPWELRYDGAAPGVANFALPVGLR